MIPEWQTSVLPSAFEEPGRTSNYQFSEPTQRQPEVDQNRRKLLISRLFRLWVRSDDAGNETACRTKILGNLF
jgi:hypothetical protein